MNSIVSVEKQIEEIKHVLVKVSLRLTALLARIFFMQPSSHVLIVCFATSSSIMYSSSSRASNSSS